MSEPIYARVKVGSVNGSKTATDKAHAAQDRMNKGLEQTFGQGVHGLKGRAMSTDNTMTTPSTVSGGTRMRAPVAPSVQADFGKGTNAMSTANTAAPIRQEKQKHIETEGPDGIFQQATGKANRILEGRALNRPGVMNRKLRLEYGDWRKNIPGNIVRGVADAVVERNPISAAVKGAFENEYGKYKSGYNSWLNRESQDFGKEAVRMATDENKRMDDDYDNLNKRPNSYTFWKQGVEEKSPVGYGNNFGFNPEYGKDYYSGEDYGYRKEGFGPTPPGKGKKNTDYSAGEFHEQEPGYPPWYTGNPNYASDAYSGYEPGTGSAEYSGPQWQSYGSHENDVLRSMGLTKNDVKPKPKGTRLREVVGAEQAENMEARDLKARNALASKLVNAYLRGDIKTPDDIYGKYGEQAYMDFDYMMRTGKKIWR